MPLLTPPAHHCSLPLPGTPPPALPIPPRPRHRHSAQDVHFGPKVLHPVRSYAPNEIMRYNGHAHVALGALTLAARNHLAPGGTRCVRAGRAKGFGWGWLQLPKDGPVQRGIHCCTGTSEAGDGMPAGFAAAGVLRRTVPVPWQTLTSCRLCTCLCLWP